MSPQLNAKQIEHVIANLEMRVSAKKVEQDALLTFQTFAPAILSAFLQDVMADPDEVVPDLCRATVAFLNAKINQLLIDLEELELMLKGVKQQQAHLNSGLVLPTGVKVG